MPASRCSSARRKFCVRSWSAATPAARSVRANPVMVATGSFMGEQSVAQDAFDVLAVLERGAERGGGPARVELVGPERQQGLGPVERLGDARRLDQVGGAQPGGGAGDLLGQGTGALRQ